MVAGREGGCCKRECEFESDCWMWWEWDGVG